MNSQKFQKYGLIAGIVCSVASMSLFALQACDSDAEASKHNEDLKRQAADEQQAHDADLRREADEEAQRLKERQAENAKIDEEIAAAKAAEAAEEANPHFDIVMQVSGLEHETTIYSHLTRTEAQTKWQALAAELNSGNKFFTVTDANELTATLMVRPEQIQYITISPYRL